MMPTPVLMIQGDRDTWSVWDSGPMLGLSSDTGDKITMRFGMSINPANLPIIYDMQKKKASRAGLRNSPGVFFAPPYAIVNC